MGKSSFILAYTVFKKLSKKGGQQACQKSLQLNNRECIVQRLITFMKQTLVSAGLYQKEEKSNRMDVQAVAGPHHFRVPRERNRRPVAPRSDMQVNTQGVSP